jgi:putative transposase
MSPFNLGLMKKIDELYTRSPFYGSPKITEALKRRGFPVGHKRIERLMRIMGIAAVCPKKKLSLPNKGHKIYPYLLRGVAVTRPNQVWSTDITYIRLLQGFAYLVAIIDWFSRYVLSWRLSNTMDTDFCLAALDDALAVARPEIFNTDQGSQFTSDAFTGRLLQAGVSISMDGRGRAFDNIFVERLWRTVKYEDIYLHDYQSVGEVRIGLRKYFRFYNIERLHQSLDYLTPEEAYLGAPPPNPRSLTLYGLPNELNGKAGPASIAKPAHPCSRLFRRSGCSPAEPYPPNG